MATNVPSVKRALPPVGWHKTVAHEPHWTTVEACEKTVLFGQNPVILFPFPRRATAMPPQTPEMHASAMVPDLL
jgi:hypothetical protein